MVVVSVVFTVVFAVVGLKIVVFAKNNKIFRYRVVAVPTPRMTAKDSTHGQNESLENSVSAECFQRILGTGRRKSASGRRKRRNADLIGAYQGYEWKCQNLPDESPDLIRWLFHLLTVLPVFRSGGL